MTHNKDNQIRRNFRSALVNKLDAKLQPWRKRNNLSIMDISRLLTKMFDDKYTSWTSVNDSILSMLNGRRCSDGLVADLVQLMKELKQEMIPVFLRDRHQGYKEMPIGCSLEERENTFSKRKDAGGRFLLKTFRNFK